MTKDFSDDLATASLVHTRHLWRTLMHNLDENEEVATIAMLTLSGMIARAATDVALERGWPSEMIAGVIQTGNDYIVNLESVLKEQGDLS